MRIDAGFGRRLAGRDNGAGRPPIIDAEPFLYNDGLEDDRRSRDDLDRTGQSYGPQNLQRESGVNTRASQHEIQWTLRPFGAWTPDNYTGTHAAVGLRPGDPGQAPGDMIPWDTPRRTLRSLPAVPWDAGTAAGPAGAPAA